MNHLQPQRRPSRPQRAFVVALVIVVNAGIGGFIDRLAGAGQAPADVAAAKPAAAARG